ncbi:transient receptor potential cation channel subfamily a member 1-like [Gigaspora margarita]|uniref:Transient receptor potential cation channel subfamily a member 1-like n=1 Tax=Gigaspora margarita TaxID=4874 RepID=A0A8H3XDT5_GIGMA|nr:transient receptor potential cation channel subfamily a member 1-like [Gigaspora margarita]
MSSSESEKSLYGDQDQTKISIDVPHGGRKINKYILSPKMNCIATLSEEDKSIVFILSAIIDVVTKSGQILSAQGLNSWAFPVVFLENRDLAIIKGDPVYRAYIFSKSKLYGIHQWTCKYSIELGKFDRCSVFQNGKLFIASYRPYIIMQWDLITQKFEMQYTLDLYGFGLIMKLNSDNTLLAVAGGSKVYVYSTKSGILMANSRKFSDLHNFCFIGSGNEERLFYSCTHGESYNSYLLNPHTHTLDKPPDNDVLSDIYPVTYQNYESIGSINIISDYIIKIDAINLSIQRLSQNKNWKNYLKRKERYYGNMHTYFNTKEIRQFLQTILEKYKKYESNQILIQDYSKDEYPSEPCTWIIECKKKDELDNELWEMNLKVKIESDKEIDVYSFRLYGGIFENKVLENGDILLVFTSCILIYTINSVKNSDVKLIYGWSCNDRSEISKAETPRHSIIIFLTSFLNLNFYKFGLEILPPPTTEFYFQLSKAGYSTREFNYFEELTLLKLYVNDMFHELLLTYNPREKIDSLLNDYYDYSLEMNESGDIYNFLLVMSQIAFMLVKLEKFNRNQRYTEKFLSTTNLLIGYDNWRDLREYYIKNDGSFLFDFQHCGTYINLFKTSFFNYLFFWISEKCSLLKKFYPQIYNILAFPYLFYSSYFTISPRETIVLMFPLLNYATYSENYSYSELFYTQDNPFTLFLDEPDYFKLWNIKALINFKWNTYGRLYYFIIWAIYSDFMSCFLIASTIPEHEISWIKQSILLVATIFLGFIHFIFEVRQLIHKPKAYIKSPWNWFDLAAILFPIITSIIWLHDIIPPIWIITISAFLLEFKFLLFFRALEYFGKYFAIMIGVAQKVFSFLFVLSIIVLAFAHSLHLLLSPTSEYSYDQPSYTDDANNPWNLVSTYKFISSNGTVEESSLIETPDDNTNLFSLFRDTSSVSSWNLKNNWTLALLLVIFSFFTTIYLLNLFITLLGMAVDETNNEESFLQLRGEILSEIELFWMLPYQRRKKNWFPAILYYKVSVKELKKYVKSVEDKKSLPSEILEISKFEDSEEILQKKIEELTKNINKELTNKMDEILTNRINEALKDPLDKFNKLIEFIEKKESE